MEINLEVEPGQVAPPTPHMKTKTSHNQTDIPFVTFWLLLLEPNTNLVWNLSRYISSYTTGGATKNNIFYEDPQEDPYGKSTVFTSAPVS